MSNNSSTTLVDQCLGYESYRSFGIFLEFSVNYVIAWICLPLCALVYGIMLVVNIRKVHAGETAYVYQSAYCLSEVLLTIGEALFILSRNFWSGQYKRSATWFVRCYACMWFTANLSLTLADVFNTLTWIFSICMAVDRVFALTKPFVYRQIDQRRHQACAVFVSILIALATSVYDWFTNYVVSSASGDGSYRIASDREFIDGPGIAATISATSIRASLAVILVTCNAATVHCYRTYLKKQSNLFTNTTRDRKEVKKKESERTLAFLCASQSAFNALDIGRALLGFTSYYMNPKLYACGDTALFLNHVVRWFLKLSDFVFMISFSQRFREMIKSAVMCRKGNRVSVGLTTVVDRNTNFGVSRM